MEHAIIVEFHAKPERRADFVAALTRHVNWTRTNEKGCMQFDMHVDEKDPHTIYLYEIYKDDAALSEHRASPSLKTFQEANKDMVASRTAWQALRRMTAKSKNAPAAKAGTPSVVIALKAKPESTADYLKQMEAHVKEFTGVEPGCLQFDIVIDKADPNAVFYYEQWESPEAHRTHFNAPLLQGFLKRTNHMIAERAAPRLSNRI
jgi:(4S)-4-hydroxy-5-phosphonooxypentane-2,3-dione isomerase